MLLISGYTLRLFIYMSQRMHSCNIGIMYTLAAPTGGKMAKSLPPITNAQTGIGEFLASKIKSNLYILVPIGTIL